MTRDHFSIWLYSLFTVGYACYCRSRDVFSTSNFCRLLNVNWVIYIQEKVLNLVSKLEEKDKAITTFMLSPEQFAEVKRNEVEQGSEKQ